MSNASGPLVLVGGGEWSEGCDFDEALLEASGASEVVVVPTGSAYESPAALVDSARSWFARLGVTVVGLDVLTRRDAFEPDHVETLRRSPFTYLAGSSPMHLRSVLKDTPALDAMVAAWHDGGVLAGTAGGADVLCDPMVDTRGGAFTVGLGVVPGIAVIPRFDTWSPDKVHRTIALASANVTVVGLPTATAVVRDPAGTWRAAGVGRVVAYRAGVEVSLDDV